ncbi:MAG: hypothetical protein JW990_09685 [Thermoleophilia bacterium]|nr:hypothetical protein [Thermoleophilia bacterium]
MSRRKKTIVTAVLAAILALAVAVPAFAATESTPAAPTDTAACGLGYGGIRGLGAGGQMSVAVSELLGMKLADLSAARQDGQSLAEIAQSKGISAGTLTSDLLEAHKAALADAVADGRITQERADLMLQNMSEWIADRIDDTQVGLPPAGRGGHGRGGQGGYGACMGTAQ